MLERDDDELSSWRQLEKSEERSDLTEYLPSNLKIVCEIIFLALGGLPGRNMTWALSFWDLVKTGHAMLAASGWSSQAKHTKRISISIRPL